MTPVIAHLGDPIDRQTGILTTPVIAHLGDPIDRQGS